MRDPTLQATALRYAAGDLPPDESESFELLLATDEAAQDALAEAVRLSAAAIGQAPPAPTPSFRDRVRDRVLASRRTPLVWAAGGAAAVAVATVVGLQLSHPEPTKPPETQASPVVPAQPPVAIAPAPRPVALTAADDAVPVPKVTTATAAEIWAEFSTTERIQKAHDDEARRRQRMREMRPPTGIGIGMIDS